MPVAAILAVFISCQTTETKKSGPELVTAAEVKEFIASYDGAWGDRDTSKMKEIMDEQYLYFTSTGGTIDRTHIIGWFTPADKYKVDTAARSEISFLLQGNTAIVSSRWIGNGTFGEEKFNDDQRCGLVLQKQNGKVKIIAEHCVQIAK